MEDRIIKSIIDSDLYKFTMQNAICKLYPRAIVKYQFINRGGTQFPQGFDYLLRQEVSKMADLQLQPEELEFLRKKCYFLDDVYFDFLKGYRFKPEEIGIIQKDGDLQVTIEGPWYRTVLWEVPLMSIISELYFKVTSQQPFSREERKNNNIKKAQTFQINNCKIADFGSRRRFSFENQLEVVSDLKSHFNSKEWLAGTSNPYIAMRLDLTPIGTFAHEWISGIAALKGYSHANRYMMEDWVNVYQGNLGIALPDTFGLDAFLKDFDTKFAKLFDGVRHDSGDPFIFSDKMINHYEKLRIDPMSKTIVFSNALDTELIVKLQNYCKGKIKSSGGIGTHLTNDVGVKPLNIVIKLMNIDGHHVIKLSDDNGKSIGDKQTIEYAKWHINYNK